MADNDENPQAMKEIILPIRQDGQKTRSYSGSFMLVSATRIAGMPDMGTTNGWSCIFARAAMVKKFFPTLSDCPISTEPAPAGATEAEIKALDQQDGSSTAQIVAKAGDDRALFYGGRGGGVRKLQTDAISSFNDGLSIVKWNNFRTDGQPTHDTEYPDIDIPLFRYAEVYLTRAEAYYRKGQPEKAVSDINELRKRANAKQISSITSDMDILDEWCREFYLEGLAAATSYVLAASRQANIYGTGRAEPLTEQPLTLTIMFILYRQPMCSTTATLHKTPVIDNMAISLQ